MTSASGIFKGKTCLAVVCLSLALASGAATPSGLTPEEERDPFQPQTAHCVMLASTRPWRLQGLVGDSSRWVGWVKQAENGWLRVRYDETATPTEGLKVRLDRAHRTLRIFPPQGDCPVSEIPLSLPFFNWAQGGAP
ncbi:HofP DNA utilization family protein [Lonsdalea quercina]|uniref:HofP DNA utilization family protein n=1 Tax=Lonsdalea quercina TaxID=71657 RepID=UPI00397598FF